MIRKSEKNPKIAIGDHRRSYPQMTDCISSDYVCCASRMKRRLEEEMKRLKREKEMEQPAIVESSEQRANQMELD